MRLTLCCAAAAAAVVAALPAPAADAWMSESAMRRAFIGKTLAGHYSNGLNWTESYLANGRLAYREPQRQAVGDWFFRGRVFCTFYDADDGHALAGGCWRALQSGANCYDFYLASLGRDPIEDDAGRVLRWNARGWRQGEPTTCAVPSA